MGYIVDLLTLPDRLDVANALIREAIHYFDDQNINIIKCSVIKNHPHERIFRKYGFLNRRQRIPVLCVPRTITDEKLRNFQTASASKVHFGYGDFDEI